MGIHATKMTKNTVLVALLHKHIDYLHRNIELTVKLLYRHKIHSDVALQYIDVTPQLNIRVIYR